MIVEFPAYGTFMIVGKTCSFFVQIAKGYIKWISSGSMKQFKNKPAFTLVQWMRANCEITSYHSI